MLCKLLWGGWGGAPIWWCKHLLYVLLWDFLNYLFRSMKCMFVWVFSFFGLPCWAILLYARHLELVCVLFPQCTRFLLIRRTRFEPLPSLDSLPPASEINLLYIWLFTFFFFFQHPATKQCIPTFGVFISDPPRKWIKLVGLVASVSEDVSYVWKTQSWLTIYEQKANELKRIFV